MANPQVVVDFVSNTAGLSKGLKSAGTETQGFGSKLKGMGRAAVAAGGVAGLAVLAGTLKVGVDEMTQASKVGAQTAAVIKSTGGAAGVTAKQVSDLAAKMLLKTGIDDETIQSGENMLLTFRNIRNETGKGNDIFTQATKTMLDMSVALGQDTKSSAMQLGKALNDPIRGVTALQRVGVTFTAAQKDQIKALVQSGDVLGAQKIILKELNKEFGGSAVAAGKTLPGQINILKESFNNLAGDMVTLLVPALSAITKFLIQNPGLAKAMVIGVLAIAAAMVVLNAALLVTSAISAPYIGLILGITAGVVALVAAAVLLYKNWDTVTGVLKAGFDTIQKAASDVFDWLKKNWPLLLGILTGPVGLAVAAIVTHWNTIKNTTTAAWNAVKSATASAWNAIQSTVTGAASSVSSAVTGAWNAVKSTSSNAWNAVKDTIAGVFNAILKQIRGDLTTIRQALYDAWDAVRNTVYNAWHAVEDTISNVFTAVLKQIRNDLGTIRQILFDAWAAVRQTVYDSWTAVKDTISNVIGDIRGFVTGLASWLAGAGQGAIGAAVSRIGRVFHAIKDGAWDTVQGVKNAINDVIGWLWRAISGVSNAAHGIAHAIKAPINAVIGAWNSLAFTIPKISIPSVKVLGKKIGGGSIGGETIGFPHVDPLARGGVIDQPTLALVGEAGREIVTPETLLRQILAENRPEVRVFIGDTELRGIVRTEYANANNGLARSLLAGGAA